MAELSHELLLQVVDYNPETGIFTWIKYPGGKAKVGSRAGSLRVDGYRRIGFLGKAVTEHRLAWLYMTGEWPKGIIDHKDRDRANNAWGNIRLVSASDSNHNRGSRNSTGFSGVSPSAGTNGRFRSQICTNGKIKNLGSFPTAEEAHKAYQIEKMKHQPLPGS